MGSICELIVLDLDEGLPIDSNLEVGAHSSRHYEAVRKAVGEGHKIESLNTETTPDNVEVDGHGLLGWWTDSVPALMRVLELWKEDGLAGDSLELVAACEDSWKAAKRRLRFVLVIF